MTVDVATSSTRRHRRMRLLAAIAAVVAVVLVLVALTTRPSSALATWTRESTSSDLAALADATVDACRERAAALIRRGEEMAPPNDPEVHAMAALPLVAHDQRGDASAALFADERGRSAAICMIVPVAGQPPYVELSAGTGLVPDDVGPVSVWSGSAASNWDYGSRWVIAGRVSDDVESLVVVPRDGEHVTATLQDGWFIAWWPASSHPVAFEVTVAGTTERIEVGDRYDAGGPPCRVPMLGPVCLWSY
jgi:hypothetical protein